ncbi:MAG: hemolysin III [Anaeromyxobacter sp. RBG_16_69_14]|nr:MAG: hemolysin III [Anaeromyxobacter sp. RBG_16_69_14]
MARTRFEARTKPLLRGVSHEIAAFVAAPASFALIARAKSYSAEVAAVVYGVSLFALFAVSAIFHRPLWPPAVRAVIARIDHSAIFLLIAGTYTPFCLLLGPGRGHALLATVWTGAGVGILIVTTWPRAPKPLMAAIYVLLGWIIIPVVPALRASIGDHALVLLLVGGLVYTAGAIVYALRKPDPFPTVFGFHEIFHVLVVAAATCHFVVVEAAIRALG